MCQCLEGQEVDWENLRTPEQQASMSMLFGPLMSGLQMGATQFPGQLSAPMTDAQKMAMKTMTKQGGYGWEQQSPKYKPVPPTDVPQLPFNFDGMGVQGTMGNQGVPKGGNVIHVDKKKGDGLPPPGPGPDPKPDPIEMMQLLMAMGMGGSPYDPRNRMG